MSGVFVLDSNGVVQPDFVGSRIHRNIPYLPANSGTQLDVFVEFNNDGNDQITFIYDHDERVTNT